jgi:hypothetical protein
MTCSISSNHELTIRELIDPKVKWRAAATPFLDESSVDSSRPHSNGGCYECPHCVGRFPDGSFTKGTGEKITAKGVPPWLYSLGGADSPPGNGKHSAACGPAPQDEEGPERSSSPGELALRPMKVIGKTLYGARYVRPDLLRACQHLTLFFTKWDKRCDRKLFRLMCYIKGSLSYRLVGWVGDRVDDLEPHLVAQHARGRNCRR